MLGQIEAPDCVQAGLHRLTGEILIVDPDASNTSLCLIEMYGMICLKSLIGRNLLTVCVTRMQSYHEQRIVKLFEIFQQHS